MEEEYRGEPTEVLLDNEINTVQSNFTDELRRKANQVIDARGCQHDKITVGEGGFGLTCLICKEKVKRSV